MDQIEIKAVLEDLGYNLIDRGDFWHAAAVYRGGDNETALQIYKNTGVWKDYVEDTPFYPFKVLIEKSAGDFEEKDIEKILKRIGEEGSSLRTIGKSKSEKIDKIYPDDVLDNFLPHYSFYNDRGISDELLASLKGGLNTGGQMYQRFVFPIYNEDGQIFGFSGRDMINKEGRPKWKHVGKKTKWVYPLHVPSYKPKQEWGNGPIFLVESIGDLLSFREHTDYNALVVFAVHVGPSLMNALISLAPEKIILSLNNDEKEDGENVGKKSSIKNYLRMLSHFDYDKLKICLPTKNDFGDMRAEDYPSWINKFEKIMEKDQRPYIIKEAEEMRRNEKLSDQLYKNLKYIK